MRIPSHSALRFIGVLLILCLALAACSGSDDEGTSFSVKQGRFTLGPTRGLTYTCGDLKGKTDSDGAFEYYEDQPVSFYVGELLLGTASGKPRITPHDFEDEDSNKTNISTFLLRSDNDQNPNNGITVSPFLAETIGNDQSLYPFDICQSIEWQGIDYLVFYDSSEDDTHDQDCTPSEDQHLVHVALHSESVDGGIFYPNTEDGETPIFSWSKSTFETNATLANLFLYTFDPDPQDPKLDPAYCMDTETHVTDGWYSPFWAMPQRYWQYLRDQADLFLDTARGKPFTGLYTGTYEGGGYSGTLRLNITLDAFASCKVEKAYGTTCNGDDDISVAGNVTDLDTGAVTFALSGCGLTFDGIVNPDSGTITGTFSDADKTVLGTFSCEH